MDVRTFRWPILAVLLTALSDCFDGNDGSTTDQPLERIAVLYVGHGEPAIFEDGDVPITFADSTPFGPHAAEIGVPVEYQHSEWAAADEEIATAMTYILLDVNGNGTKHEMGISPAGDVPPFFTWEAFHADIQ